MSDSFLHEAAQNSYQIFKSKIKNKKPIAVDVLLKAYDTTLRLIQSGLRLIQSGRTVPLIAAIILLFQQTFKTA